MGNKIECALIHEDYSKKTLECVHPNKRCMHRMKGKCNWVDLGDKELFAQKRNITSNKFNSEAKKGVLRVKVMMIVDGFYEFIKDKYDIYPSNTDNKFNNLDFPFNYDGHFWSRLMIEKALEESTIEEYLNTLPDKSKHLFNQIMEELQTFFE